LITFWLVPFFGGSDFVGHSRILSNGVFGYFEEVCSSAFFFTGVALLAFPVPIIVGEQANDDANAYDCDEQGKRFRAHKWISGRFARPVDAGGFKFVCGRQ
jgi:hypothetical protein